jgi:CDP-paratose 2-epimerase
MKNPKPGGVYNLGGGRNNSASILETIDMIYEMSGYKLNYKYDETNRIGDHICYISDLTKIKTDFPEWDIRHSLESIVKSMIEAEVNRKNK